MNLYQLGFNELHYFVEAGDIHGAITIWRRAMLARGLVDPEDEPDTTAWLNDEPVIRDDVMTASEAKLREEVDQLRVQLAAAVGETNRLQEQAQAYHNVRAIVSEQQWIEQRRRERAAENGAAEKGSA